MTRNYRESYGIFACNGILFNHESPRRGETFVTRKITRGLARIKLGKDKKLYLGNLEAKRDWTDVRDVVRGYLLALRKGVSGEVYNICSEKTISVKEMLDILLKFSKVKVKIRQDPQRMRPSDVQVLLGDCSKFRKITGWKPQIPFEKTMEDLLNYWRERV